MLVQITNTDNNKEQSSELMDAFIEKVVSDLSAFNILLGLQNELILNILNAVEINGETSPQLLKLKLCYNKLLSYTDINEQTVIRVAKALDLNDDYTSLLLYNFL